jgi:hypothetical protein
MATIAPIHWPSSGSAGDERFFARAALLMAAVIVVGFSMQLAAGRSSFSAPLIVHAHAIVFMGWIAIYVTQNLLVSGGRVNLHRRLGWLAAAWMVPMLILGIAVTVGMIRSGQVPFFFQPLHFMVFNPVSLLAFTGLIVAAIVLRRRTDWHRRLHFCGTALLLGPGFGRLLPMPLLQPYAWELTFLATLLFPLAGVIADLRRSGRVHPAWRWGIGAMVGTFLLIQAISYGPLGPQLYDMVAAGSPGAEVAPLAFSSPPADGQITGR